MPPTPYELLEFLITTMARKPPAIQLRMGASVARYLDDLAYSYKGPERQGLRSLSKEIWAQVFQFAEFSTAAKDATIQFLERFAQTHLSTYKTEAAIQLVSALPAPGNHKAPRVLRSASHGVSYGTDARRPLSDLTERIYAAYWALRFEGVHGASGLIAEALNRHKIPTGPRQSDGTWSEFEVRGRIKQFDKRFKSDRNRKRRREELVASWKMRYRRTVPSASA